MANDNPTIRCTIYTRQSVEREGDFSSCDAQRDACEAYIGAMRHEGWLCLDERFDDLGESGGSLERPALRRLLEAVIARRVDAIVVHRFDRLTRSMADWIRLHELFDDARVKLVVVTSGHNEMGAGITDLMNNILAAFGQFEREIIGERLRESRALRRARGLRSAGRVPFGYLSSSKTKQLEPHPEEAGIVREFFRRAAQGESGAAIARWANNEGISTKGDRKRSGGRWTGRTVLQLLRNPLYTGHRVDGERLVKGVHPALVDKETADAAAKSIASRRTRKPSSRGGVPELDRDPFMLRGVIICGGCGCPMTTSSSKKVTIENFTEVARYYRCRGRAGQPACRPPVQIAARVVEEQVLALLKKPERFHELESKTRSVLEGLLPYWPIFNRGELNEWVRALVWSARWNPRWRRVSLELDTITLERFADEYEHLFDGQLPAKRRRRRR